MKNLKNVNNTLREMSHLMLYNTSNYKQSIENCVSEILNKFIEVIVEYVRFILEKSETNNKRYNNFIFERGLETLIHVFSIIFYYTKNLDLSLYHTQKSYYFYIEFIEQISNDNVTFLQLSSRDAVLFVYKKTIFDLNNDFKKNMKEPNLEEIKNLEIVNKYIDIYKHIIFFTIKHFGFNCGNKKEYIDIISSQIKNISEKCNKYKYNQIECIYFFTRSLCYIQKIDIQFFFKLLDEFIKKVSNNKKINEKEIKDKIYDLEINNFINNNELDKIVEFIFNN
jgi:hypothetical protein